MLLPNRWPIECRRPAARFRCIALTSAIHEPAEERLVAEVVDQRGRLDHLICNAGRLIEGSVSQTSIEDWRAAVDANLSSAFFLTRAALAGMTSRGFGRSSTSAPSRPWWGSPVEAAYGAAKAGLIGLTRSVARETARGGVTVNCVIPASSRPT